MTPYQALALIERLLCEAHWQKLTPWERTFCIGILHVAAAGKLQDMTDKQRSTLLQLHATRIILPEVPEADAKEYAQSEKVRKGRP